ncbi:helix-turn-helix domain-containing protein [Paenibacillus aceris]|uniref:AraC-like DNA-binding protein n=1 Tax=Paenibacillus aceris TaxID=869555 RepID=A0ABS4HUN1_9BACL|nr:helix-turn-helix domain-containing protein [Paenibacillus aceris]MBP1962273.1 AraC-like DNA-binding protein [Paenibacillus aceris]NHW37101.1 AraC family transcriptional regulator [Paenibacillus aceris]
MNLFKGNFFIKAIAISLLTVMAVSMFITISCDRYVTNVFDKHHIDDQVRMNGLISSHVDALLESIVKGASNMMMDQEILQAIYVRDLEHQTDKMLQIQHKLNAYSNTVKDIYSVDLYIPSSVLLISSANGIIPSTSMSDDTMRLYQTIEALRKPMWMFTRQSTQENMISFFQPLPVQSDFPQAYLTIHIRERALNNIITISQDVPIESLIISDTGKIISSANKNTLGQFLDADMEKMLKDILDTPASAGYTIDRSRNTFTTYSKLASSEWIVAIRYPLDAFFSYKRDIFWHLIKLELIVMIGAILILISSYSYLFSPVTRLIRELGDTVKDKKVRFLDERKIIAEFLRHKQEEILQLQEQNRRQTVSIKELTYYRLLQGPESFIAFSDAFLHENSLDENSKYWILIVEPDLSSTESKFSEDEPALLIFAISNLCEEIMKQNFSDAHIFPSLDMKQVIVICFTPSQMNERQIARISAQVAESIQSTVNNYLNIPVSIGVGNAYSIREGIHHSYREASECLMERLVKGSGSIITIREMKAPFIFQYPYELEALMIKALKQNNQEETLRVFKNMIQYMLDAKVNSRRLLQTSQMLYFSVLRILYETTDNQALVAQWDLSPPPQWKTVDELVYWFEFDFFPEVFRAIELTNENRGHQTVEAVKQYLYESATQMQSLTSVAEQFGINPSYLSRIFKKMTGQSFVQFTANLKIEKAKHLLLNSALSINEIAEAVGYTERTFGRVFKNVTGTTPANFRMQNKS